MDDLADRLRDAGTALLDLRGPLVAGEPWPLSAVYGTEPEADWGPREVLAHVNEMLPYWVAQLSVVLAADPAGPPPPFGRVATDAERIGRIAADRDLAIDPLLDEIAIGLNAATTFIGAMSDADGERIGLHPLAVIFALLAFGQLFGFTGVLLALPASAAILVALRHVRAAYTGSALYRDVP